mmetsp:Transcript_39113/g.94547  ORF Transcript_39113/g.94547 Transcript_39113/m.94547 type:complete len:225 (-) Transcript_39113:162-836(-)
MASIEEKDEEESPSSNTVKFNVGGKLYEVSKSLLERFPTTILAQKVEEVENEASSSTTPIFFDRDPDRFAFCLDYMRDNGNVHLPETVSKAALLKELKFFGFADTIDETKIHDENATQNCLARFYDHTKGTKRRIVALEGNVRALERDIKKRKDEIQERQKEIRLEKLALKFLADSVEDECALDADIIELGNLRSDPYFVRCCDQLALRVVGGNSNTRVYLRRL